MDSAELRDPDRSVIRQHDQNMAGPYWLDTRYELPNPGFYMCWCDRCRAVHGKVRRLAAHAARNTLLVLDATSGLLSVVCVNCVRPDDVVLMRGGSHNPTSQLRGVAKRRA
jgi:hypothetical protein